MKKPISLSKRRKACVTLMLLMPFVFLHVPVAAIGYSMVNRSVVCYHAAAGDVSKTTMSSLLFEAYTLSGNPRLVAHALQPSAFESLYNINLIITPAIPAPPTVTCPGNLNAATESGLCTATVSGLAATIFDPDGDITSLRWTMTGATVASSPVTGINNLTSYTFNEGITTVTYTVADAGGASANCSFTVTVTDNQAPVITCPANIETTYTEGDCGAIISVGIPTTTDNCGINSVVGVRSDGLPLTDPFPTGTTTITWTASDVNGLTASCSQTVRITEGIILANYSFIGATAYPVSPNYSATGITCDATSTEPFNVLASMGTVTGSMAFVNNSVANPSIYMDPSTGTNTRYWQFHLSGDSLYKYRKFKLYVQARRGNRAAQAINFSYSTDPMSYTVNGSMAIVLSNTWYEKVVDWSTINLINNPSNLYIRLFASNGTGGVGDNRLFIDNFQVVGIDGPLARPNFASIPENTPATIPVLNNDYFGCYGPAALNPISLVEFPAQGSLVLNPDSTYTYTPNPNVNGDDSFVYQICDAAGNCDTSIVNIHIAPVNFAPTISCPGNVFSGSDVGICGAQANNISANIFDVDGNIVSLTWTMTGATTASSPLTGINNLSSYIFNFGITTMTYTVTDADGQSASCSFTVTIYDSENPSIICPPDTVISIPNCATFATGVTLAPPQINDNCGILNLTNDAPAQFPLGDTPVIWTVYDINGNFSQCGQIVTVVLAPPMTLNMSMTPVNCFNGNDGTATVTVTNGTAPYTYSWNTVPVQTTATATNLTAGTYTVVVYDADSCFATDSVTVTQPATPLSASISNIVDVLCFGDATGSVTATASGGTPPYQYSIDSITYQAGGTFNGLAAGVYSLFVRDANGCDTTLSFTINQPDSALTVAISSSSDIQCAGQTNGTATALASGGTDPYSYLWNTVPPQNTATISGLAAGTYTVTVDDVNGCGPVTATVTIDEPLPITANASATPILCPGDSTTVTMTGSGGTGTLVFTFNGITQTGNGVFNGIPAGLYNWSVTDSLGCGPVTGVLTITDPDSIDASITVTVPVPCAGGTGTVTITATGGTAPYTYIFNGVTQSGNSVFSGISAGTGYPWSVTDANGCSTVAGTFDVTEPDTLEATAVETIPVPCVGGTATVTILASGGTPPNTYTLNGVTQVGNGIFTGVPAGSGFVWSVDDANGCGPVSGTIDITEPPIPTASASVTIPIPCIGGTATITIVASNGAPPYTFTFNGVTQVGNGVFTGITAGTYNWSVTDDNGCGPVTGTLNVAAPPIPAASAAVTSPIQCNGETATVTITAVNGVAPYTYIFNGITQIGNGVFTPVVAGSYSWSVTDANGCGPVTGIIVVDEPDVLTANASVTSPIICIGATGTVTIVASGGTQPYTYTFNGVTQTGNGVFTGITAGSGYVWSVDDANGCGPVTGTLDVTEPPIPAATASVTTPILCSGGFATITIVASSGTAPYTYTFNGVTQVGNGVFTGVAAGTYTWSVTDANGCGPVNGSLDVNEPLPISAIATITTPVICIGAAATVTIVANGGTSPYTYTFNGITQVGNGVFTGIPAGNGYVWSVTDSNSCPPATGTLDITEPPIPAATAAVSIPIPCNGETATVTISATNGAAPYTYTFNGITQLGDSVFTGIPAGTGYPWSVTDANGCGPVTGLLDITEPPVLTASITAQSEHICVGDSTGFATVTPVGGTPGYSYLWNTVPPQTTQTATNLPVGTYTVTVTDTNGCVTTASATIIDIEPIEANAGPSQLLCNHDVTFLVGNDPSPGIGSWTLISGPNIPTIFPPTGSVAVVTGMIASPIPYIFSYSIDNEGCVRSDTMTVINFNPPTPAYAGTDQEFCSVTGNVTTTLTGNTPVFGTGLWSQISGPTTAIISEPSNPVTNVSNLTYGVYAFQWVITNGICQVTADVVNIFVNAPPVAFAGSDQAICEGAPVALNTSFAGNYTSLLWTSTGTGIFDDPAMLHPTYTPSITDVMNGSVALVLTAFAEEPCTDAVDQMILTISASPLVDAGADGTICQDTPFTVTGALVSNCASILWTTTGSGTLSGNTTLNPVYTPSAGETGTVQLILTGTANPPCSDAADTLDLLISPVVTVNAGPDTAICEGQTLHLTGTIVSDYSGLLWTTSGTGAFDNPAIPAPVYTPSPNDLIDGYVYLTLTAFGIEPCGDMSDQMKLVLNKVPVSNAGPDATICHGSTYTVIGATAMNFSNIIWTTNGNGTLTDTNTLSPTYLPAEGETGEITLTLTVTSSACGSASDDMALLILSTATASAGNDLATCSTTPVPITGAQAAGYTSILWTTNGSGTFSDNSLLNPVYSPSTADAAIGMVVLTLNVTGLQGCGDTTDQLLLSITPLPEVNAGPDLTICQGADITLTAATAVNYSSVLWTVNPASAGTFVDATTLSPIFTPNAGFAGIVTLILSVQGSLECGSAIVSDELFLTVNESAVADAGPDQTIVPGSSTILIGAVSGGSGFYAWNWQPPEMLVNPSVQNTTTLPMTDETTFTLSILDLNTGCISTDNITVFLNETGSGIRAVADFDTTLVNTPTTIPVLANDLNPNALPIEINFCSFPMHGIVNINSDNTITYSPYPEYEGDDSFCYQICTMGQPVMCSDTLVYINVRQPDVNDLFIFNGISPNGDGNNDKWKIRGIENYRDNHVTIYNRWGDVIRKIADYNNTTRSWDGTNENGKLMPNGTYFYVLEIDDVGIRKGWILIRGEE